MPQIPIGSQDTLTGTIRDVSGSAKVAVDLSGKTLEILGRMRDGTVKVFTAIPDPDQVANKGVYSYDVGASDFDLIGPATLRARITDGGKPHLSKEKPLVVTR